jgi:hypothetical protein
MIATVQVIRNADDKAKVGTRSLPITSFPDRPTMWNFRRHPARMKFELTALFENLIREITILRYPDAPREIASVW